MKMEIQPYSEPRPPLRRQNQLKMKGFLLHNTRKLSTDLVRVANLISLPCRRKMKNKEFRNWLCAAAQLNEKKSSISRPFVMWLLADCFVHFTSSIFRSLPFCQVNWLGICSFVIKISTVDWVRLINYDLSGGR